jgi:hypothetical protein
MPGSEGKSVRRSMTNGPRPAALVALLAVAIAFGASGCFLPILTAIPSVIGLASAMYKSNTGGDSDPDSRAQIADASTSDSTSKPTANLTVGNLCQMMAISHPDMTLVELRKNGAGAPEYRELHLLNSTNEAHWTPAISSETGPDGWIPAVNFLKMNFNPPLNAEIPDAGSCYLAYVPTAIDPSNPSQSAELKLPATGDVGTFSWAGRVYQYTVARTLPCLSPTS